MTDHKVVSKDEWIAARKQLLQREKELTHLRDQVSKERRELPWVKVDKDYRFSGPNGEESLSALFDGASQLIVYHFMMGPDWNEGCKSCSFIADHYTGSVAHLQARDVTLVTVSRAPLEKIDAFKARMGWKHKWVSSLGSDFNFDYNVSFTPEQIQNKTGIYNYGPSQFPVDEAPGLSVFYKDADGTIYHTFSSYSRGLDMLITAYHLLDMVPKGRSEEGLPYSMSWLRHHDKY